MRSNSCQPRAGPTGITKTGSGKLTMTNDNHDFRGSKNIYVSSGAAFSA